MNKCFKTAAILCAVLLPLWGATSAYAQSNSNDDKKQVKALSQRTASRLSDAQEELKNEQYSDALSDLRDLAESVKDQDYALALTEQMIAYVYLDQEKYEPALAHLRKAVDLNALPDQAQHNALLTLAQLYAMRNEYQKTIDLLEQWFKNEKNPPASAYVLAASSYYNLDELQTAREYVKRAIDKGDSPHEDWYGLLVGIDYKLEDYDEAIDTLRTMVSYWPDKGDYWRNLYGLYLAQDKTREGLVVMRVAYDKGMIEDAEGLLNLARLEIMYKMPYYAAQVLTKGMDSGTIDSDLDNLQLLVAAWTQARETDKALDTLDKAAGLADDGSLYLKKAQLCYQQAEWECTIEAADNAVDKGGLDNPGKAYILKGMSLSQNKKYQSAKNVFAKAEQYEDSKKQAQNWINFINQTLAATS